VSEDPIEEIEEVREKEKENRVMSKFGSLTEQFQQA